MSKTVTVWLHCSASDWGNAVAIDEWHRKRNFRMIGYHRVFLNGKMAHGQPYVERLDGIVETGRPYGVTGAHTLGHNKDIGWCLIGNSGKFTTKQIVSVVHEIASLIEVDGYDVVRVRQHSEADPVNKPFCAGFTDEEMIEFNIVGNGYGEFITRRK